MAGLRHTDFSTPTHGQNLRGQSHRLTQIGACLMLLCAAVFWGAGNIANKTLLAHIGPLTAIGWRCLLATLLVLPLCHFERSAKTESGWLRSGVVVSGLFAAALGFQQVAYLNTSVTNVSFLVNTASVMTPVLAWLVCKERPGKQIICAGILTLCGAYLMSGAHLSVSQLNLGDISCMASAAFYAAWMVALGRHAVQHGRPLATSALQFALTACLAAPLALAFESPSLAGAAAAWRELWFLGMFSTAGAFALMACAQRHVPASIAAVLVSAESVFGAVGAHVFLNERISVGGLAGAGLIMLAIVIAAGMGVAQSNRHAIRSPDPTPEFTPANAALELPEPQGIHPYAHGPYEQPFFPFIKS